MEVPLVEFFVAAEARRYLTDKESRRGQLSVHGASRTRATVGHACVLMKAELKEYMSYDLGSDCKDDWLLGQWLMLGGCDPLPRRRCLAQTPPSYQPPYPLDESLWRVPDDRNVPWDGYTCSNFSCLSGRSSDNKDFELEKERLRWVAGNASGATHMEFPITDVLAVKATGEIMINLDVNVGTGTFAARMREWGVTVVSTVLNAGAPYSETIALRGLVPLYATLNQRLPFFDNTMDLIHTTGVLDGWTDLHRMDFVLFNWDRMLRPGGLLWVEGFVCERKRLDDYSYMFH